MAQVCDICGKGPQFGNNISHAHNVTKRRWNVNLRPVRAKIGSATKRIRVCTSCLRSGKVVKALKNYEGGFTRYDLKVIRTWMPASYSTPTTAIALNKGCSAVSAIQFVIPIPMI